MYENDIKDYIESNLPELSDRLYPVMVVDPDDGVNVAYTFSEVSRDHLSQSQLTLNVICEDYDTGMKIHEKISGILAMEEDVPFVMYGGTRFRSELIPGGGRLYNEEIQLWELKRYYKIDWRNTNG